MEICLTLRQFHGELHTKAMYYVYIYICITLSFFQFQVLFVNGKIFFNFYLNCRKISTVTLRYFLNSFLNIVHYNFISKLAIVLRCLKLTARWLSHIQYIKYNAPTLQNLWSTYDKICCLCLHCHRFP